VRNENKERVYTENEVEEMRDWKKIDTLMEWGSGKNEERN
jgi:hypothetical protein